MVSQNEFNHHKFDANASICANVMLRWEALQFYFFLNLFYIGRTPEELREETYIFL
jgi:hypothetical protein